MIGASESGGILGIDRAALSYLNISALDIGELKVQQILDAKLDQLLDRAKKHPDEITELKTYAGRDLYISLSLSEKYRLNARIYHPYRNSATKN